MKKNNPRLLMLSSFYFILVPTTYVIVTIIAAFVEELRYSVTQLQYSPLWIGLFLCRGHVKELVPLVKYLIKVKRLNDTK